MPKILGFVFNLPQTSLLIDEDYKPYTWRAVGKTLRSWEKVGISVSLRDSISLHIFNYDVRLFAVWACGCTNLLMLYSAYVMLDEQVRKLYDI